MGKQKWRKLRNNNKKIISIVIIFEKQNETNGEKSSNIANKQLTHEILKKEEIQEHKRYVCVGEE